MSVNDHIVDKNTAAQRDGVKPNVAVLRTATDSDILMGYEIFLGRKPESPFVVARARGKPLAGFVSELLLSSEFRTSVLEALQGGRDLPHECGSAAPSAGQIDWLLSYLAAPDDAVELLRSAPTWRDWLRVVIAVLVRCRMYKPAWPPQADLAGDSPGAPSPQQRIIKGFIDSVDQSGVVLGWAYDMAAPSKPLMLRLFIDRSYVCDVLCGALRLDVAAAGHAAEVGFRVSLPRKACDGQQHTFSFRDIDDNPVFLPDSAESAVEEHSFSIGTYFDPVFYADQYLTGPASGDQRELDHWNHIGKDMGFAPNADVMVELLAEQGNTLPDKFSANSYRYLNHDIAGKISEDWQAELHYLQHGKQESRPYRLTETQFILEVYSDGEAASIEEIANRVGQNEVYRDVSDMLTRNGVTSDAILRHFKAEDYACAAPMRFRNRLQAIRHFLESGREALAPICFDLAFDPLFYRAQLGPEHASSAMSDADLYLHFLNKGLDANVPPNESAALHQLGLTSLPAYPEGFDPKIYCQRNPDLTDLKHASRWKVIASVMASGLAEGRQGCALDATTCDVYRVAADRLSLGHSYKSARTLYEKVLGAFPSHMMALRHYGDCLLHLEEYFQATLVYERLIDLGLDNIWTHINLTNCLERQQRWMDAAEAIYRISERHPGDRGLRQRYDDVTRAGFDTLSGEATWLAEHGHYTQARDAMEAACAILTLRLSRQAPPVHRFRTCKRIAIVADLGLPQCKLYRVDQKCEHLAAAGYAVTVFDYHSEIPAYLDASSDFDAVILYRVPAKPETIAVVEAAREAGLATFYEIDDLMFNSAVFPDSFESYGGQISPSTYAGLVIGTVALRYAMSVCDYAIASTVPLADAMAPLVVRRKAFVHRNALGRVHHRGMSPGGPGGDSRVSLFYGTGTKAHNEDFEQELAPCLARLFERHGERIRLVVIGHLTMPEILRPYEDRITQLDPIWDIELYWSLLRGMSINIAVLKPGRIADCKSEIKWLEAAMLEVPSVVSATATYREVIEDNKTGILVRDAEHWFTALDGLIRSPAKRRTMGARAKRAVMERYNVPAMAANISAIIGSVCPSPQPAAPRRTRVLLVNVLFPPQSFGGATRVAAHNALDIADAYGGEFEIEVFTSVEGEAVGHRVRTYVWEGIRVTAISTPAEPNIDLKVDDPKMAAAFAAVVDRFAPDLIHFHCIQRLTTSLCDVAMERDIPYLIAAHDSWWLSDRQFVIDELGNHVFYHFGDPVAQIKAGGKPSLARMLAKQRCLQRAAKVLAVSDPFAGIYAGCGFDNIMVVENGLPPIEPHPRTRSEDGRVRVAHIGGAAFHKGFNLVRAVISTGDFPRLRHLQIDHSPQLRSRWGSTEVIHRSIVPQKDVGRLYAEIDVLLAPSLWPESYGLVTREAAACGCWVVASDRGAIGGDVIPGTGFVIDVSSPKPLRDVLQEINDNPQTYTRSPTVSHKIRTARQQALELAEIYREFAARPGRQIKAPASWVSSSGAPGAHATFLSAPPPGPPSAPLRP